MYIQIYLVNPTLSAGTTILTCLYGPFYGFFILVLNVHDLSVVKNTSRFILLGFYCHISYSVDMAMKN